MQCQNMCHSAQHQTILLSPGIWLHPPIRIRLASPASFFLVDVLSLPRLPFTVAAWRQTLEATRVS